MSGKYALIIGNTEYTDPGLAQLTAPGKDAEDFARVLKDKEIGAFDNVKVIVNEPSASVIEAIDEFFDQKKPDDMLVLYFSGHGIKDEIGSLYLAFKNTIRSRLRSTAIKSDYIKEAMDQSRSKRQVLILDCCNSGAFPQGTKAELGGTMGMTQAFQGYGRFVLTASDATQFAWEGDKVIGETDNSLFTHFLVKGLEGEADSDGDGRITVDELYDYAYQQISSVTPKQTPTKSASKQEGEIVLRQNMRIEDIKPVNLPDDLLEEIEDHRPYVREAAVQKLEKILKGKNLGMARSAAEALEKISNDENTTRRVSQVATQILDSYKQTLQKTEEERLAKLELEHLAQEEAERLAAQKAKEERLADEAERQRVATQKAEEERIAKAKLEAERMAEEKRRADKAEKQRLAKLEVKRLAAQKEEEERTTKAKLEEKRRQAEKEETSRIAAEKAEEERIVQAKLDAERLAQENQRAKQKHEVIQTKADQDAIRNIRERASTNVNTSAATPSHNKRALTFSRRFMVIGALGVFFLAMNWLASGVRNNNNATATAESQASKTMQARVATNSARAITTNTASAKATNSARAITTNTASAKATNSARAITTSTAQVMNYGPISGSLDHDADDGFIESDMANVNVRDFIVSGTFQNPYPTTTGPWNYGFLFRWKDLDNQYRIIITSEKQWRLLFRDGNSKSTIVQEGQLANLDIAENGKNDMLLYSLGEIGILFVNGEFVTELDLSAQTSSGDIGAATGFYSGSEINGDTTKYEGFQVSPIQLFYGPISGSLDHDASDELIETNKANVNVRDFIVSGIFQNPYPTTTGPWNYGFVFRWKDSDNQYRIIITSEKQWRLLFRDSSSTSTVLQEGQLANLDITENGKNDMLLYSLGEIGILFVNGEFVTELDLSAGTSSGDIGIATGFYTGSEINGNTTKYEGFSIWEIP